MITGFVLIEHWADAERMAIAFLTLLLLVGPLALLFGADSRLDERMRLPEWRRR
jgi:hypothetical protein